MVWHFFLVRKLKKLYEPLTEGLVPGTTNAKKNGIASISKFLPCFCTSVFSTLPLIYLYRSLLELASVLNLLGRQPLEAEPLALQPVLSLQEPSF